MNSSTMQERDWVIANDSLGNPSVTESLIQPPRSFEFPKPDLWPLWRIRFERYLNAADLSGKNESEKISTLCHIMGEESEAILVQAMPDTEGKSLTDALEAFTDWFCPKTNVLMERYRFNTRIQEPDESVDQFITALKTLAESCQYGVMKDVLIRDRIVVGLWETKISEELLQKSYLTLDEAVRIATQADLKLGETAQAYAQRQVALDNKSKVLYAKLGKTMNRLSPENVNFLAKQFRLIHIVSAEQLQGVVDQFYDKAIAEPSRIPLYGRFCREISTLKVTDPNEGEGSKDDIIFRKLIVTRCQTEFEKHFENVEASAEPIQKKEVQLAHIAFIGELCKQNLLIVKIIHWCICHLLLHMSDVNLECLCKLLSTTGENLEYKDQNLDKYFKQMLDIVSGRIPNSISPSVRFMLQDVIELKMNNWERIKVDSSPQIVDQIPKQAKTIHPVENIQPIDTLTSTSQIESEKRGSGPAGGGPLRTRVVPRVRARRRSQKRSTETPKITNVPSFMCDPRTGNATTSQWPKNLYANAPITVTPYTLPYTPANDVPTVNSNFLINVPEGGDYIPLQPLY